MPERNGLQLIQGFQERLTTGASLDQLRTKAATQRERTAARRLLAEFVFAYYCAKLGHPRARYTEAREKLLMQRLVDNDDDVNTLLYAVDGVFHDDWVMGKDPRSTKRYDTLHFIFRTWDQVERFAEERKGYIAEKPHGQAVKYGLVTGKAQGMLPASQPFADPSLVGKVEVQERRA